MENTLFNGINQMLSEESILKFFVDGNLYCLDLTHFSNDGHQIRETKFRDNSLENLINQLEKSLSLGSKREKQSCEYSAIDWLLTKGFTVTLNSAYGMTFVTVNTNKQTEFSEPLYEELLEKKPTFEKAFSSCNSWAGELASQIDPEFDLNDDKSIIK